eukprot:gnl/MRDRNA2_/MRDRNA2_18072_c0_seq1.p1 gnl/MRDRNA2_/MRDRNA2_18072_c0~~gnl/MRDRNA2_/MRDRNA2_18072_c0_seq1.p1  ORF type:complete len:254 (-),score=39.97 gnl/MRDRNA2_/MRDRNA2_18072_c0_seq1:4-765(-)
MLICDGVLEALHDMNKIFMPQWTGMAVPGRVAGKLAVPLTDDQKAEVTKVLNEDMPGRMATFERALSKSGGPFFCGKKLTICDLAVFVYIGGILDGTHIEGISPSVCDECPLLLALIKRVADLPKVKEWNAKVEALYMCRLLSKVPPPGADEHLAARAVAEWPEWQCASYPGSPSGRFQESRWWEAPGRERAAEERCLVTAGCATLWPDGGGPPVDIAKGDWVTFRRGFQCLWVVHKAIAKRYAYFDKDGHEI